MADDKGAMEMRDSGGVPGATGQATCAETGSVIDEMENDHFDDLLREAGARGREYRRGLPRCTRWMNSLGSSFTPDSLREQLNHCC